MNRGLIVVRSPRPDLQLQALRTALSLSLGDRQADLMVAGDAVPILAPAPASEAEHCLRTIGQVGLRVQVDAETGYSQPGGSVEVVPHEEFVSRLSGAPFVQVF